MHRGQVAVQHKDDTGVKYLWLIWARAHWCILNSLLTLMERSNAMTIVKCAVDTSIQSKW